MFKLRDSVVLFIPIFFVHYTSFAQLLWEPSSDSTVMSAELAKSKFKNLKLKEIDLTDLSYQPLKIPSYKNTIVNLWQIDCTGCINKLRANWKNKNEIWINLDRTPNDILRAQSFLKSEKIDIVAYLDVVQSVRKQMGKFLLPKKLLVKSSQVVEVID